MVNLWQQERQQTSFYYTMNLHLLTTLLRSSSSFMKSWVRQDYHFDIMIETRNGTYGTMGESKSSVYETISDSMWSVYGTISMTRCCIYDSRSEMRWERILTLWVRQGDQYITTWKKQNILLLHHQSTFIENNCKIKGIIWDSLNETSCSIYDTTSETKCGIYDEMSDTWSHSLCHQWITWSHSVCY